MTTKSPGAGRLILLAGGLIVGGTLALALLGALAGDPEGSGGPTPGATAQPSATTTPAAAAVPIGLQDGSCDLEADGDGPFYPGPSASRAYDATFTRGPRIPGLPNYVPQGLTAWADWDGDSESLLVLGSYRKGRESRLYGIDPVTGREVGAVAVAESHLGGIAVVDTWLFTQHKNGKGDESVRRYRLADLRSALKAPGTPFLDAVGEPQEVGDADFLAGGPGQLWAGLYEADGPGRMDRFAVDAEGLLTRDGDPWVVPPRTQGALVTDEHFVFSISNRRDRGRVWVVERGDRRDQATARSRCFAAPSMGEGITAADGTAYLAFEGAAAPYDSPQTRNRISHLHAAPMDVLVPR